MARRYNSWAGNPNGTAEDVTKCVESVLYNRVLLRQCARRRGHGYKDLYCAHHAKSLTADKQIHIANKEGQV